MEARGRLGRENKLGPVMPTRRPGQSRKWTPALSRTNGQALAYVTTRLLTKDEARRIAVNTNAGGRVYGPGGVPVTIHYKPTANYFVVVTRKGQRRLWQWQIQQRPPTCKRMSGEGFETEFEARLAGAKALRALVSHMRKQ